MTTFDPAEVRKAVAEFTPRRPQKFQAVKNFAHRDQRADCSAAFHKPRARHELAFSGWQ
jgi:hypothetical protein